MSPDSKYQLSKSLLCTSSLPLSLEVDIIQSALGHSIVNKTALDWNNPSSSHISLLRI